LNFSKETRLQALASEKSELASKRDQIDERGPALLGQILKLRRDILRELEDGDGGDASDDEQDDDDDDVTVDGAAVNDEL
jgi:hypothetical protein